MGFIEEHLTFIYHICISSSFKVNIILLIDKIYYLSFFYVLVIR